jgi:hypothetical protein
MAKPDLNLDFLHRVALVRRAKLRKTRLGLGTDLTPDELDAVLPPLGNFRDRIRLARRTLVYPAPTEVE